MKITVRQNGGTMWEEAVSSIEDIEGAVLSNPYYKEINYFIITKDDRAICEGEIPLMYQEDKEEWLEAHQNEVLEKITDALEGKTKGDYIEIEYPISWYS